MLFAYEKQQEHSDKTYIYNRDESLGVEYALAWT